MSKIKWITLVELLAIIIIPVIFLIISIPKISSELKQYRKLTFITTAKLISVNAENKYLENKSFDLEDLITCEDVVDLESDYANCGVYINNRTAYVTLNGKGKYEGMNVCGGTVDSTTIVDACDDTCIMNELIDVKTPYEVDNYDRCTRYTGEVFKNLRKYTDDELHSFCKGKTVKGWTFSDNIEYMLNKGFTERELVGNNVIKGSINNVCVPRDVHITCYTYDVYGTKDDKYIEITGYDDICGSNIVIPEEIDGITVEGIGDNAFNGKKVYSVKFPNTIRYIGSNSFRGYGEDFSDSLNGVKLSGTLDMSNMINLDTIGYFAFADNELTSVKLPNSITKIDGYAFSGNQISGELDLSNTKLTEIGEYAFSSSKISNIKLPESVTTIECTAFAGNQISGILDLSGLVNLTKIGVEAFAVNQITGLKLPSSIITLGNGAFSHNQINGELDLSLNTNLIEIGSNAFVDNQITDIKLPSSIAKIGNAAFGKGETSNPNLTEIINLSKNDFDWVKIIKKGESNTCTFVTGVCEDISISES